MDELVSSGRVVLKARYSIYPIQLCCVGQTGYVGQTDQDSGARAEGTLRLHTRWRAYSTQATTASSPYSSAVWGRLARAIECVPRARYGYIRGGVPTARRLLRRESALHDYAHVSPPHDCVRTPYERLRMGLIECRVFDTEATAKQKNTLIE